MSSADNLNDRDAQAAITRLWPHGDDENNPQIYAILDGARDDRIVDLLRLSGLQYACMYSGKLSPTLQRAAPYIVHLSPKAELTRTLLQQAWGKSWGMLIEAAPAVSMEQLRNHFRRLQRVMTEDGMPLVFRFYDPRVLRVYLPTCTLSELAQFFGPVSKIVIEAEEGGDAGAIEYRKIAQGIDTQVRKAATGRTPASAPDWQRDGGARLCSEQMLAILNHAAWHAGKLAILLPQLRLRLPNAPTAIQQQWMDAILANWSQIVTQLRTDSEDIAFHLGLLASSLHDWRSAEACFTASLQHCGAHHATHYNLAVTHWQRAGHDAARYHLECAIESAPENDRYRREHASLKAWRENCRACLGSDRLLAFRDQPNAIYATLLGPHHATALLRHQSDPELTRLARLPRHQSVAGARRWIQTQATLQGKTTLAVMHPKYGLIGVFAMERHSDAASFYYWIASAFQRQGHGRIALRLLKRLAFKQGIRYLYSSVYESNTRSIGVMQRTGFRVLPHTWEDAKGERLPYYYLSLQSAQEKKQAENGDGLFNKLQQLLQTIGGNAAGRDRPAIEAPAAAQIESEAASC